MSQYDHEAPFGYTTDADHRHLHEMSKLANKAERERYKKNGGGGGGCGFLFLILLAIIVQGIVNIF